ncbi:MAG TPA: TlpA disulfide reductase family protein [Gemmatimonadaceae bacterium]|nr:TlpA disulfide reductase family protein [Gemmatimonadaceae bacterium]
MANDLTGDYDVVAQFSLDAVNRILAAMHRGKRLPHALSMAVDDYPDPRIGVAAISIVDVHGEAMLDPAKVRIAAHANAAASVGRLSEEVIRNVDPVVNFRRDPLPPRVRGLDGAASSVSPPPLETRTHEVPLGPGDARGFAGHATDRADIIDGIGTGESYSYLSGVAQLQLGPPTMQIAGNRTDRAEVHTPVMVRYLPEEQTMPLARFMRGDIVTTFGVKQVSSAAGANVVIDLAGAVRFNTNWSSSSLDPNERSAIDKALAKSLKESFEPSSTPFPSNVRRMHFKGFPGENTVAVMMNVTTDNAAGPGSVGTVFLHPDDHFAIAVNGEAITVPFAAAVNSSIAPRTQKTDTKVVVDYLIGTKTFHIYTSIYILDAKVELIDLVFGAFAGMPIVPGTGAILLTILVQVRFGWQGKPDVIPDPVDFDFTITQAFTLTLNGRNVGIQRIGDVVVNIPGGVPTVEADEARKKATTIFNNAWNSQVSGIQQKIDNALNANGLQDLLKSLMNPTLSTAASPGNAPEQVNPELTYTSFEIKPAGIALHGSITVPPWPRPHVEFDKDPWAPASNPEYRALRSWIPGGTVKEYRWDYGKQGVVKDSHRFITVNAPALSPMSSKVCMTFTGSRITASGPIFYETVSSPRSCKWTSPPVVKFPGIDWSAADRPQTVVPKPRPDPEMAFEAVAHVSPWAQDGINGGTVNLVVTFPDEASLGTLETLPQALARSGRTDTATAMLCVITPEQFERVPPVDGVMFADDASAWERLLGIRHRPATVLLDPAGETVWRHEGELEPGALTEALRNHLGAGGQFYPQFVESPLREGQLSPNFLFDAEPGERLTLRKLTGRPLVLLFWRSSSEPSVATLRNLHRAFRRSDAEAPLILAIDDGQDGEFARGLAAADEGGLIVVADPERQIARAYGVSVWPTVVFLDASGLVRDVRMGLISEDELEQPERERTRADDRDEAPRLNQPDSRHSERSAD